LISTYQVADQYFPRKEYLGMEDGHNNAFPPAFLQSDGFVQYCVGHDQGYL
jgi:hypothetical protein